MACPFSQSFTKTSYEGDEEEGKDVTEDHPRYNRGRRDDKLKPFRQSSVQITSSLLGEDIDEEEDTQTLNLKHLRAAVLMLTNPSVRNNLLFLLLPLYNHLQKFNNETITQMNIR